MTDFAALAGVKKPAAPVDFAGQAGIKKLANGNLDFAGAAGLTSQKPAQMFAGQIDQAAYASAIQKQQAGQPLLPIEQRALDSMAASRKTLSMAGAALQPFNAAGDVTRGVIKDIKDDVTTGQYGHTAGGYAGISQAVGHLTYGLSENLPGQAGARSRGVTGAQLLAGTPYANSGPAAMWTEILADPVMAATGLGLGLKGLSTVGKLAKVVELGKTAAGKTMIQGALDTVGKAGGTALHIGDEATGLPALMRAVAAPAPNTAALVGKLAPALAPTVGADLAKGGVAGAFGGMVGRAGNTIINTSTPIVGPILKVLKGDAVTYGDMFYTPEVKAATYTPQQVQNEAFRDGQKVASSNLKTELTGAGVDQLKQMQAAVSGLKPAEAADLNKLIGAFNTTTDPAMAYEAVRQLRDLSGKVGKNLDAPFVQAVQASDRLGQEVLGSQLKAQGLPVVLDPAVTAANQAAKTPEDLLSQVGKYTGTDGRPRGILMQSYTGRADPGKIIQDTRAAEALNGPTPGVSTITDPAKTEQAIRDAAAQVVAPPAPIMPVGKAAPTAPPPVNQQSVADAVTQAVTPQNIPALPPGATRPTADVMAELFGGGQQVAPPLKPFDPTLFGPNAETVYRGEKTIGDYAGLNPNLSPAALSSTEDVRLAKQHSDLLYTTPDRGMADGFAEPMYPQDTPSIRTLRIAPSKTVDLTDIAPSGTARSMEQVNQIFDRLGIPAEQRDTLKNLWGATPAWEATIARNGIRDAGPLQIYDLFRDDRAAISKAALQSQGVDTLRFGPDGSREVITLDRSRAAEVLPDGTLKPTSPDVVPYNVAAPRTPQDVISDLVNGDRKAATAGQDAAALVPTPPPASVSDAVTSVPAADPAVASAADLGKLGGQMAGGISDSMYDMLHGKYLAGDTTEVGQPSNILIGAQQLKAQGVDLTREQFPDFAQAFSQNLTETSGAPDRQAQLQKFLGEYTPPASLTDAAASVPVLTPAAATPEQVMGDLISGTKNTTPVTSDLPIGGKANPGPVQAARTLVEPENATQFGLDQYRGWVQTLTPEEKAAFGAYKGTYYDEINAALRGKTSAVSIVSPELIDQYTQDLTSALDKAAIPQPVTTFRGIGQSSQTTRQLKASLEAGDLQAGTVLTDPAFVSTSLGSEGADVFAGKGGTFMTIHAPAGTRGAYLDGLFNGSEKELLVQRNTPLVVDSAAMQGGRLHIEAHFDPVRNTDVPSVGVTGKSDFSPAFSPAAEPAPKTIPIDLSGGGMLSAKTPDEVMAAIMRGNPTADPYVTGDPLGRTAQADSKAVALPITKPDTMVTKSVPVTYRTVPQVDTSALDWSSLPDRQARLAVQREIGNGFKLEQNKAGEFVPNQASVTMPLDHPVISHYFPNDAIEGARFGGDTGGYQQVTRMERQAVPSWYDPKNPAPMDAQRAAHDAALQGQQTAAFPNDFAQNMRNLEGVGNADHLHLGEAFASDAKVGKPPSTPAEISAARNDYAARVQAMGGTPPTPEELAAYQRQLARTAAAQKLQNIDAQAVTTHLSDFFKANPEATRYEATLSAAQAFGLGKRGARLMRDALGQAESGFMREMSSLERKEFAQSIMRGDASGGGPGSLAAKLVRNPVQVSAQFKQLFPEELNNMRVAADQARTRTNIIVKADNLRAYHEYLTNTEQHLTGSQLASIQGRPVSQLTPSELAWRESIANSLSREGAPSGWKVLDKDYGPFKSGDAVPFWAHGDLFTSGAMDDAGVSSAVLKRGGLDVYNRVWGTLNSTILGNTMTIISDQVRLFEQAVLWGVRPDEMANGMIRRLAASSNPEGRAMLQAMRQSGIESAGLEANIRMDQKALERTAVRLSGESELSRFQRIVDAMIRWQEYGTATDRLALTNPVAKISSDIAHVGGAKMFQFRAKIFDLQRESLYFHYLEQPGMTPLLAAKAATDVLMDMRLAPAYSKVMSKVWPFFGWLALGTPRSIMGVFKAPAMSHLVQSAGALSDTYNQSDQNGVSRELAREGGYINLGMNERSGSKLYLNPTTWDLENALPSLLDWSGMKLGPIGLPWYLALANGMQSGIDRYGSNIFKSVLGNNPGGYAAAHALDPAATDRIAARFVYGFFAPNYAPGGTRSRNFVASVLETAKLPADGSRDITIAKTLTESPWGTAALRFMQNGPTTVMGAPLTGSSHSSFAAEVPSMALSLTRYALPIDSIQPSLSEQGAARQQLSTLMLNMKDYQKQMVKQLQGMYTGGASPAQLQDKQTEYQKGMQRRANDIQRLSDQAR